VAAGLSVWALHADLGRHLSGFGSVAKPVEVATLASPARLEARPSVAALPFKNLSGDAAHDFFSDGITEAFDTDGAEFGTARLEAALEAGRGGSAVELCAFGASSSSSESKSGAPGWRRSSVI